MKLSAELTARGFIHQHTGHSLADILDDTKRIVYLGIDPTANSAHVGHLTLWVLLRHLKQAGHTVVFLLGGGTGLIGDPKPDAERVLQNKTTINKNTVAISAQAQTIVGGGDDTVVFANNTDWLSPVLLIDFLRDIGKHFTVNELIKKETIAARLKTDTGLSYTEFAYPLLQAYDYLTLNQRYGCDLQIGGSDQWGNIVAGVDLVRRQTQNQVHALTTPLVVDKNTGKKFGKSESNAVWLDPQKTSPYHFYQFWFNVSDENVINYLKLFTFISLADIATLEKEHAINPGARQAQKQLAAAVTTLVHGEKITEQVVAVSDTLFGEKRITDLNQEAVLLLKTVAPHVGVPTNTLLVDVLVKAKLAVSKREARTFIESGAVTLDSKKVSDVETVLPNTPQQLLRRGKKHHTVITIES